jgi:RecA/RadA recombinase
MKPFDLTKLAKLAAKKNIISGFHDPKDWIDTGNYALNYRISSSFRKGIPLGKVTVFAGESGAGKSYIVSGNLVKNAQKMGIMPVILDSEFALDEKWLQNLGVDTDPSKLLRFPVSLVDDCANLVNEFMDLYLEEHGSSPEEDRPGILFIVDSLGMLSTPTEVDQFNKGEMKGDMGRKAKQLKAFVTQCLKMFGPHKIGLVATNHTYKSQDMFNPDDVVSGGSGFIYASSIVVTMNKLKLKEDEDGNKVSEVRGIRAKVKCIKSRYAKPFEEVEIQIPWDGGMNPYSGLVDMFQKVGVITKDGNKLKYVARDGTEHKYFEKAFKKNTELLDLMMDEYEETVPDEDVTGVDETPPDLTEND